MNNQTNSARPVSHHSVDQLALRVLKVKAGGYMPKQYTSVFRDFFPEFCVANPDYEYQLRQLMNNRVMKGHADYIAKLEEMEELLKAS